MCARAAGDEDAYLAKLQERAERLMQEAEMIE